MLKIFLIVLLSIILLICLLFSLRIRFFVSVGTNIKTTVSIKVLGFKYILGQNKKAPTTPLQQEPKKENAVKAFIKKNGLDGAIKITADTIKAFFSRFKMLYKRLKIHKFNLNITVATDNAALTGISYGAVCAVLYPALSLVEQKRKIRDGEVNIGCDYTKDTPEVLLESECSVRIWFLLSAALYVLYKYYESSKIVKEKK